MGLINFITTPFYLFLLLAIAIAVRPLATNRDTFRYFLPALVAKFSGAVALGLIYQFYYGGGDTIAAYHGGATQIWKAFLDSPLFAVKLIFAGKDFDNDTFTYASQIIAYGDLPTYFVVRVAGLFSIFTLNSYYSNALLFSTISFSGSWAMYVAFYRLFPQLHKPLAIIILFIPSVVFWGSGILKDTITFGAVGWLFYAFSTYFIERKGSIIHLMILAVSAAVLLHVKIYIAMCLFPSLIMLLFTSRNAQLKNKTIRYIVAPFLFLVAGALAIQSVNYLGKINRLYSIEQFAYRAQVNAEWLAYVSRKQGGSFYSLGNDDDFSNSGLAKKFIPAVWTTLYRPYLWEANNPVMLLNAIESLLVLSFSLYILYKLGVGSLISKSMSNPFVLPFLVYSILFAFAIGVSTYNFGTLVRYKIPMIPFFLIALLLLKQKNTLLPNANNYH